MSIYRLGSNGKEVERIQARLNELGLYRGMFKVLGRTGACPDIHRKYTANPHWAKGLRQRKLYIAKATLRGSRGEL